MIFPNDVPKSKFAFAFKPLEYVIQSDCWICTSHTRNDAGYPKVYRNGKHRYASRYVYELEKGTIPEGMIILHSCDNRACINPNHLSVGTCAENSADMVSKGRSLKGEKNHGGMKLTEEDVRKIRTDSRPQLEIARDHGITQGIVSSIKHRRIWKHVI